MKGFVVGDGLLQRVFRMRDGGELGLCAVALSRLEPFLRGLLVCDGTLTRALEAHTLSEVEVSLVSQEHHPVPDRYASWLAISGREDCIRRRVMIHVGSAPVPAVLAESYLVEDRLPCEFLAALAQEPLGLGESLDRADQASRREFLCFGLRGVVDWAPANITGDFLVRLYRIVIDDRPAMIITENFVLKPTSDPYRLAGLPSRESGQPQQIGASPHAYAPPEHQLGGDGGPQQPTRERNP